MQIEVLELKIKDGFSQSVNTATCTGLVLHVFGDGKATLMGSNHPQANPKHEDFDAQDETIWEVLEADGLPFEFIGNGLMGLDQVPCYVRVKADADMKAILKIKRGK